MLLVKQIDFRFKVRNQFVWKQTFKLDVWKVLFEYAHKGDFMLMRDLIIGYLHLDLFVGHQQYFGFSFEFQGRIRYFSLHF